MRVRQTRLDETATKLFSESSVHIHVLHISAKEKFIDRRSFDLVQSKKKNLVASNRTSSSMLKTVLHSDNELLPFLVTFVGDVVEDSRGKRDVRCSVEFKNNTE